MAPTRRPPHPNTLFRLLPIGPLAEDVLAADQNQHLVSEHAGVLGLDVGAVPSATHDGVTLATLGRNGDIFIGYPDVSRIQCSFEVNTDAKMVLCVDRSARNTTQLHRCADAADAVVMPFMVRKPRRVYVGPGVNPVVGMCGVRRNRLQFRLEWTPAATAAIKARVAQGAIGFAVQPAAAPTAQNCETGQKTRAKGLRAKSNMTRMRAHRLGEIGSGSFGTVYKAVDVDTGDLLAVKVIRRASARSADEWDRFKREVTHLSQVQHPCIVQLLGTRNWESDEAEIFLGLMDGSLERLTLAWPAGGQAAFASVVDGMLHQMLQALDVLRQHDLLHRDVKPANILYQVRHDGQYQFRLADFGISNAEGMAVTHAGTGLYMAPEFYSLGPQTHKADVWSLYVTVLWTTNHGGFRDLAARCPSPGTVKQHVLALATPGAGGGGGALDALCAMGAEDPARRASAAQMLVKLYGGQGLTTRRADVPPL